MKFASQGMRKWNLIPSASQEADEIFVLLPQQILQAFPQYNQKVPDIVGLEYSVISGKWTK